MRDVLESLGIHKASVTWFDNAVKLDKGRVLALGYCCYGKGVAFIAVYSPNEPVTHEWLKLIVVRDVVYGRWRGVDCCDDAFWCLNLKCHYNKAQVKHFKRYGLKTTKDLERMHSFLEECASKLSLESKGSLVVAFEKPPLTVKRAGKD